MGTEPSQTPLAFFWEFAAQSFDVQHVDLNDCRNSRSFSKRFDIGIEAARFLFGVPDNTRLFPGFSLGNLMRIPVAHAPPFRDDPTTGVPTGDKQDARLG